GGGRAGREGVGRRRSVARGAARGGTGLPRPCGPGPSAARSGGTMQPLLPAAETRTAEAEADRRGLPPSILMENAGTAVAEAALALGGATARVLVGAGPRTNRGDRYV